MMLKPGFRCYQVSMRRELPESDGILENTGLMRFPNFINVLKGEMSVVGPRPERQFFIDQIVIRNPEFRELLRIKPGITSWGQVKYGYATNVDEMLERLEYDLYYLKTDHYGLI